MSFLYLHSIPFHSIHPTPSKKKNFLKEENIPSIHQRSNEKDQKTKVKDEKTKRQSRRQRQTTRSR
jgi:hypothetical protein